MQNLNPLIISPNEVSFQNTSDLKFLYNNKVMTLPAGNSLWMTDKGHYTIQIIADENYAAYSFITSVPTTKADDKSVTTRTVIDQQDQIQAARKLQLAAVDKAAEVARGQYITLGSGQAMEYEAVSKEATACLADSEPTAEKYPMLAATIGIDIDPQTNEAATDVSGVARSAMAAWDFWKQIGAQIREKRLSAKAAINAAESVEDIGIAANVDWSTAP